MVALAALSFAPFISSAGLVTCGGPGSTVDCNFETLFEMINTFIRYAIFIAFPITACIFAYAGWLLVTDQGSGKNVSEAKKLIMDAGEGFIIMLLAWTFIKFILDKLLDPSYSPVLNSLFRNSS